jgi:hypothetical protein
VPRPQAHLHHVAVRFVDLAGEGLLPQVGDGYQAAALADVHPAAGGGMW